MKPSVLISMLAAAGLVAGASAQSFITTPGITANLDLTWQEDPVYPHNDNGVLEPDERALILMTASFTGQFTHVSFLPPIGPFSSGVITGLLHCYVDIRSGSGDPLGVYNGGVTTPTSSSVGPNADEAGATGYGVRGGWRYAGVWVNGQPVYNGMANLDPYQWPDDPPHANQTNPIANLERLGWQPASYAPRTQAFTVAPAASAGATVMGLYLDCDGGTTGAPGFLPRESITFGSVNIPIVPAPSTVMIMLAGCGVAARRQRREASR